MPNLFLLYPTHPKYFRLSQSIMLGNGKLWQLSQLNRYHSITLVKFQFGTYLLYDTILDIRHHLRYNYYGFWTVIRNLNVENPGIKYILQL